MTDDDLSHLKDRLQEAARPETAPTKPAGNGMGDAFGLAIDLAVAVGVGLFIGIELDHWLGTKPWMMLIFLILGVAAGFRNFYLFAQKLLRSDKDSEGQNG